MGDEKVMMLESRPPVQDLVFQVYGRHLHPELFEILATKTVERENYKLRVDITTTGHQITFDHPELTLTEIAASSTQLLPEAKRLMGFKLKQGLSKRLTCVNNIHYEMCFHVETLAPDIFLKIHNEILQDGVKRGLIHHFKNPHRFSLPPLGFITADARPGCIVTNTFHTYPAEFTIVKTQSLFERR